MSIEPEYHALRAPWRVWRVSGLPPCARVRVCARAYRCKQATLHTLQTGARTGVGQFGALAPPLTRSGSVAEAEGLEEGEPDG